MTRYAKPADRPVSPHLQIYRLSATMMMSIAHRITGGLLYFGTLLLAMWLISVATGPHYFAYVNAMFSSTIGRLVLLGYTWALIHHMLGGVRHLLWDIGIGFGRRPARFLAWATLAGSISLTILIWLLGYYVRGEIVS